MGSYESQNISNGYVDGGMGENRNDGKEYNLTLSCRFNIVECLKWRLHTKIVGQVQKLVLVEIPSKQVISWEEITSSEDEWWDPNNKSPKCIQYCNKSIVVYGN